mmetsp:Transcript_2209/g.3041  ORF Transcript_2209/g.3041 Transcript_2209/m.3041 type:complete len:84 (+) Transcript_2209:283-534(+)
MQGTFPCCSVVYLLQSKLFNKEEISIFYLLVRLSHTEPVGAFRLNSVFDFFFERIGALGNALERPIGVHTSERAAPITVARIR